MKPYYQDKYATIYHGDSEQLVKEIDGYNVVITDPPYGMSYQSAWRTEWQRKEKIIGDDHFPMWVFELKPSVASFVFCRWDNLKEIPKPTSFIVWNKLRHSMGDLNHEFGRMWEGVAFYAGEAHKWSNGRPVDIIPAPCVPPERLLHPNEKPLGIINALLDTCISPETVVLDCFCGSGSTLQACKDNRVKSVGIELDERYCEIAAKRLSQEVLEF